MMQKITKLRRRNKYIDGGMSRAVVVKHLAIHQYSDR